MQFVHLFLKDSESDILKPLFKSIQCLHAVFVIGFKCFGWNMYWEQMRYEEKNF